MEIPWNSFPPMISHIWYIYIYMNRKDRMIEHGHFFKDRYKYIMSCQSWIPLDLGGIKSMWLMSMARLLPWCAEKLLQLGITGPKIYNALLLNSKFWKQSGRLVHEQVVLDKFGKLDVAAPLTWKSEKYWKKYCLTSRYISLCRVHPSVSSVSRNVKLQEGSCPEQDWSLCCRSARMGWHGDLAVFLGLKLAVVQLEWFWTRSRWGGADGQDSSSASGHFAWCCYNF